ncbi:MAG TPA: NAD-dependent epimerase/dehydratase family protein [Steroidobacteraceae bacterium]
MTGGPRTLVTGASGFIGQHCVRYLADRGWQVTALDVHALPEPVAGVQFKVIDLCDRTQLAAALAGQEVVFNLASVHLDVGASDEKFEAVNVRAVAQLVELCAKAGVRRLVHVSSVGVYGHVAHPPAAEDAPLSPVNTYERTKRAGEEAARKAAVQFGVDLVIVRPSWVYGAGCPRTHKLIGALRRGRFFYIGPARNLRHPIYIDDFLDGLVLAAQAGPEVAGRTYNLAGPDFMHIDEMVRTFAQAVGAREPKLRIPRWLGLSLGGAAELAGSVLKVDPPISRRTLAFFENDNAFDISAARTQLHFDPRTDLLTGLRRTLTVMGA